MSSSYGENIKLTLFGQSHSAAIGMTLEGIPPGKKIDADKMQSFLSRRMPGRDLLSTQRMEADKPEFISGLVNGITCGAPITAIIRNTDTRPQDYSLFKTVPRPGHADYTAGIKYYGFQDYSGGGHFSGRITAPLCIAGGICSQILEKEGITVYAGIKSIGLIKDTKKLCPSDSEKNFPVADDEKGEQMKEAILSARAKGDSVGGIIECIAEGLPAGLGDPMFDGMENRISAIVFGIPAIKGIEFGAGFNSAEMYGSENNDRFIIESGKVKTKTNNSGGILGGITNGMPLVFRVAVKPTPSISKIQKTVNLCTMQETELTVSGRHDPCIVPRAVPCVEAAAAVAIYDALLSRRKDLL